ncbi:protein kinase [Candidatus Uabimicrobium sp. HlEnr_7]|uniref:protein kinase domain-containing protein n=1 Tax=Candidatus Uabimicrobium helgolandensis TaxID=3095367 RepID=UPI0035592DB7
MDTNDNKKCFANRFLLQEQLGKGTTGEVYKVFDKHREKTLALKIIRSCKDQNQVQRFIREIKIMQKLDHSNIIKIFDYGKHKNPYFTMDLIEGKTLEAWLKSGDISLKDSVNILINVANGISYAHSKDVIHRDLKPENIMLKSDKTPIVMDFGAAFTEELDGTRLTQPGMFLGTPAYMSPEQATGDINGVTTLSDIYSLGVILYEATTGQLPFTGPIASLMLKIVREQPTPPSEINNDIPKMLEQIILKAMEKVPSERYNSTSEMVFELEKFVNPKKIAIAPISKVAKTSVALSSKTRQIKKKARLKNRRKRKSLNTSSAILISSFSVVILFFFFMSQSFQTEKTEEKLTAKQQTEKAQEKLTTKRQTGKIEEKRIAKQQTVKAQAKLTAKQQTEKAQKKRTVKQQTEKAQEKLTAKWQNKKVKTKEKEIIPKKLSFGKNLIKNGSFETPEVNSLGSITYPRGFLFPFWRGNGPIEIMIGYTKYAYPHHGKKCLELDSDGFGVRQISQHLRLNKGQKYLVKFAFRARKDSPLNSNGVKVLVNKKVFFELTKPSSYKWTIHQFEFICRSQGTTLSFVDAGIVDSLGSHIDSIELLPIIEK